jgi:PAS domain S-box-containing protein
MTWPPNPYVLALWIIAASLVVLAAVAWGKRVHTRGARSFTFFTLAGAVWALAEGMQNAAIDPAIQLTWLQLKYLGVATLPIGFLVFANDYTRQTAWLNRFVVTLLLVVPSITVALAWTYPLQDVLWQSVASVGGRLEVANGPWFWVHTGSSYLWLEIGSFYLMRGYVGTPRGYRAQVTWVLFAVLVPWVANVAVVFADLTLPVDPTPLTFAVSAWAFAQSLFSHRLLDIVPVARETVMRHLADPVLVLDRRQRVLQLNPAAATLFAIDAADDAVGRTAAELLHDQPDLVRALGAEVLAEHDLTWRRGDDAERHLRAQVTPLADRRGRLTGHLVRLQDIGRQVLAERTLRESEKRLAEQEAYLTALQEVTSGLAARRPVGELLEAVLRRAAEAVGAPHGFVHLVAANGAVLERHRALGRFDDLPDLLFRSGEGLAGRAWQERRPVAVPDYAAWSGKLRGVDLGWARGAIAVPLAGRDEVLGVLALARPRDDRRPFSGAEETLLVSFARLGTIALENVRLIEEIEARRRESDQLARIGTAMQEPTSLQERMDLLLNAIQEVVGFERAVVWLPTPAGDALHTTSWIGFDADVGRDGGREHRVALDGSVPLLEQAYRLGEERVLEEGAPVPERWRARGLAASSPLLRSRAPAVLPLVSRGRTVGVLAVDNPYSRRPLGEKLPALRRFATSAAVAIDSARLYEDVQRELTERSAAEAELRRSEERYRTILDTIQDAYFETDARGLLRMVNPAFVEGVGAAAAAEVLGRPYRHFVDASDVRTLVDTFRAVLASGEPVQRREFVFRRVDGTTFHGEVSIGPVLSDTGTVVGFRGLVRDVSDRKRFEEGLHEAKEVAEAANASKSAFLANVSHELRTPLTSILGFARLIERRFEDVLEPALREHEDRKVQRAVQQVRTNAGIIYSESQRLTHLINDVLDLAKIEAGRVDWRMAWLDLAEVVRRAAQATHGLFDQKPEVHLVMDAPDGLPAAIGDRDRLTQVAINLISNAVKFTPAGAITLSVAREDDPELGPSLVARVRDTGVGIAPEDHATVFEQFRQVGDTLTEKPQGTGLGLPICKQIVEHHGGRMWLESALGAGSTFAFAIPLEAPAEVAEAARNAASDAAGADAVVGVAAVEVAAAGPDAAAAAARPDVGRRPPAPAPTAIGDAAASDGALERAAADGAAHEAGLRRFVGSTVREAEAALRRRVEALVRRTRSGHEGDEATTRVLVVDDDPQIRALLRQELEEAGHAVVEAADGREALAAVAAHRPDLVVLDVMMPELTGFDVAAVLKGDPATASVPIVILSVVQDEERGARLGVARYFTKPVDAHALVEEVAVVLRDAAAGTRLVLVDLEDADPEDRRQARRLREALHGAGFGVDVAATVDAALAAFGGRAAGDGAAPGAAPDLVLAAADVARRSDLAGAARTAGVPVVLFQ